MMFRVYSTIKKVVIISGVLVLLVAPQISAISSSNYTIEEDFFGAGGSAESNSNSYSARDSLGASAVGGSEGANYNTDSGTITPDEPTLSFSVGSTNVALGALNPSLTKTGTATFSVLNYTSYGYVVQTIGDPPDNGTHTLNAINPAASSSVGTEQFGINVVENTNPTIFGANPVQVPDSSFSSGQAATGYNTTNVYKYVPGDIIASASESSGRTDYTVSYIANISTNTPGGDYSSQQTLVVTGTY